MKRTPLRIAAVSAMAAAIALGTVSAAEAHPGKHPAKHHYSKSKAAQAKARAAAKKLAATKSHVAREANQKVKALAYAEKRIVRAELGTDNTTAIKKNIAADKAALAALGKRVGYAKTLSDANKAHALVAAYRPSVYDQVRAVLRSDNALQVKANGVNTTIQTLTATAAAKKAAGADVTAAEKALTEATALTLKGVASVGASEDKILTVHANTPKRGCDSALKVAKSETKKATIALVQASAKVETAKRVLASVAAPAAARR